MRCSPERREQTPSLHLYTFRAIDTTLAPRPGLGDNPIPYSTDSTDGFKVSIDVFEKEEKKSEGNMEYPTYTLAWERRHCQLHWLHLSHMMIYVREKPVLPNPCLGFHFIAQNILAR